MDQDPDDLDAIIGRGITPGRVIVGLLVLISFGVWGYAYSGFADRTPPDTLDDPSFAVAAEPICETAKAKVEALPSAIHANSSQERAANIREANRLLSEMTNDLEAARTGTERDHNIVDLWLNRWRILISDREDYATRLHDDPNALFYISAEAGRRAEKSLSYVADVNDMPSCGAPVDVG